MLKINRLHFLDAKSGENDTGSHVLFAISYVPNVRGRAMLPDSTVPVFSYI